MLFGVRPDEQRRLVAAGNTDAGLRALRRPVVRLPDAAARRAAGQRRVLRPVAGHQGLSRCRRRLPPRAAPAGGRARPTPAERCWLRRVHPLQTRDLSARRSAVWLRRQGWRRAWCTTSSGPRRTCSSRRSRCRSTRGSRSGRWPRDRRRRSGCGSRRPWSRSGRTRRRREPLLALVRGAMTSEAVATMLRDGFLRHRRGVPRAGGPRTRRDAAHAARGVPGARHGAVPVRGRRRAAGLDRRRRAGRAAGAGAAAPPARLSTAARA